MTSVFPHASIRWLAIFLLTTVAASCDTSTVRQVPVATSTSQPESTPLPTAVQLGYHRYVGTVGNQEVIVDMNIGIINNTDREQKLRTQTEISIRMYYRSTGQEHWLGNVAGVRPDEWLETTYETTATPPSIVSDVLVPGFCAEQPPGLPLLTGWYTPPGQRKALPVRLRESYTDGVRYEFLEEVSWGPSAIAATEDTDSTEVAQTYLHLLGPDTLRPTLARLQCPPPEARRRGRLALAARLDPDEYYRDEIKVTLNEAGLLGYKRTIERGFPFSRYYTESRPCYLLDLRTGRSLPLMEQLRPGGREQLQRMLTGQALADTVAVRARAHWLQGGQLLLPTGGFEVTPTGLVAFYQEPASQERIYPYSQTLTWAKVRPLLRPNSPLQRLLRIRGLVNKRSEQ